MGTENPFCPTNQIILYCHFPSPLCLSLPLPPPHSILLPSLPSFFPLPDSPNLSLPDPLRKKASDVKDVSQGMGNFPFPRVQSHQISWRHWAQKIHGYFSVWFEHCSTFCSRSHAQEESTFNNGSIWYCWVPSFLPYRMTFHCHQNGKV